MPRLSGQLMYRRATLGVGTLTLTGSTIFSFFTDLEKYTNINTSTYGNNSTLVTDTFAGNKWRISTLELWCLL